MGRSALLLILVTIGISSVASAEDLGPAIGVRAPDIGAPLDQSEKRRPLTSLMGEKGVVFFFFRSAVW